MIDLTPLLYLLTGAWVYEWGRNGRMSLPSFPQAFRPRLRVTPAQASHEAPIRDVGEVPPRTEMQREWDAGTQAIANYEAIQKDLAERGEVVRTDKWLTADMAAGEIVS